eukprot:TRINITY_DN13874_c0_g1_i1.p1 TRINITY_DN13874_c0_g1~~TRINITY_DN13874_c0_g1_i1.p1  ORF type:complete len:1304 (+),score=307.08 TRINITY_DN13874_c0_g1_i1:32-3943(+)
MSKSNSKYTLLDDTMHQAHINESGTTIKKGQAKFTRLISSEKQHSTALDDSEEEITDIPLQATLPTTTLEDDSTLEEVTGEEQTKPLLTKAANTKTQNEIPEQELSEILGGMKVAGKYVARSTKKNKRGFIIGILTVFLVVMFITILQGSIGISSIIFLKLSENQVGDYDLMVSGPNFLTNFTNLEYQINSFEEVSGSSPRWTLIGKLQNVNNPTLSFQNDSILASTMILVIDNEREKKMGVGREWKYPTLGKKEIHLSSTLLRWLNFRENSGDVAALHINIPDLLSQTLGSEQSLSETLLNMISSQIPLNISSILPKEILQQLIESALPRMKFSSNFTVRDGIDTPNGKYPSALGNVVVLESSSLSSIIGEFSEQGLSVFSSTWDAFILNNTNITGSILNNEVLKNITINTNETLNSALEQFPPLNITIGNFSLDFSTVANATLNTLGFDVHNTTVKQLILLVNSSSQVPDHISATDFIILIFPFVNTNPQIGNFSFDVLFPNAREALRNITNNFRPDDFAMSVIVNSLNHFSLYNGDSKTVKKHVNNFANDLSDHLNGQCKISANLLTSLNAFQFIKLFLDQIMLLVTAIFTFLGSFLIYSLLLSDVEAKTYEYGMLRALGMKNYVLFELIGIQSLSFAIPGVISGLLFGWAIFLIVSKIVSLYAVSPFIMVLDNLTLGLAFFIGMVMPIVANIGPIMRALSKTLRDALDLYHQVQNDVLVSITRLQDVGISVWLLVISVLVTVFGFVTYYLIPFSFLFGNLTLFFSIMCSILLLTLGGLSTISFAFQPLLEKIISFFLIFGKGREAMRILVVKNLSSHKRRNLKTAIMLTTSISFIIFAGCSFAMIGYLIGSMLSMTLGSDVVVYAINNKIPLDEVSMRNWLVTEGSQKKSKIKDFTFVAFDISRSSEEFKGSYISNLAQTPKQKIFLSGVESNFLKGTNTEYLQISEESSQFKYNSLSDGKKDIIESLFTHAGQQKLDFEKLGIKIPPEIASTFENISSNSSKSSFDVYTNYIDVIIPEGLRDSLSVDTKTPLWMSVRYSKRLEKHESETKYKRIFFLGKARAMVSMMPGFIFSKFRSLTMAASNVIVSMDQYKRIQREIYEDLYGKDFNQTEPRKERLLIRMESGSTQSEREYVVNSLKNFVHDDITQVLDVATLIETASSAVAILNTFFTVVGVIAITLCFFMSWLSFHSNVRENAWEFAVLRSIGLKAWSAALTFIYEALCLTFSSIILGGLVGISVALLFVSQLVMFSGVPLSVRVPSLLVSLSVVLAIVTAIVASLAASKKIASDPIAHTLKQA